MPTNRYICAFYGRRDSYQLPIALQEHGRLERFITEFYARGWMQRLACLMPANHAERLMRRQTATLDESRIDTCLGLLAWEKLRGLYGVPQRRLYGETAAQLSLRAAEAAKRAKANLLLYHSYAWEAFSACYTYDPVKVLFQFHPHMDYENQIYEQDAVNFPQFADSIHLAEHVGVPPELLERVKNAWRKADRILCASNFTKQSLVWAGAEESKCFVVPYGNDASETPPVYSPSAQGFQVLFVGSGTARKGLHHLLLAWSLSRLSGPKRLILVCRDIYPTLAALAERTPDVSLFRGVSRADLLRLYSESHLFAMPSLCEGFGQVYLEALTQGCPVLGTTNTCLPAIGSESDGVFMVEPGNVEAIANRLEKLQGLLSGNEGLRKAARNCVASRPWSRFREELINALPAG